MDVFPTIQAPAYPFGEKLEDPALSTKMENGYVISRARFTKLRRTFHLAWNMLPIADYLALRNFWVSVQGGSNIFQWIYPIIPGDTDSEKAFTVRFISGDIEFKLVAPGYYSGEITLQEV